MSVRDGDVYWSGAVPNKDRGGGVLSAPTTGGDVRVVAELSSDCDPSGVVVDDTYVYGTTLGCPPFGPAVLDRVPRGGGGRVTLWSSTTLSIKSIAVQGGHIYLVTEGNGAGGVVDVPPVGESRMLASGDARAVAADSSHVFFSRGDGVFAVGFAGGDVQTLASGLDHPSWLALDADSVFVASLGSIKEELGSAARSSASPVRAGHRS
jgi:hypothetical protein